MTTITSLPEDYTNFNQRSFQTWNSDAKLIVISEKLIVDLSSFINVTDFTNELLGQANSGLKLYRSIDGGVSIRGGLQYIGAGLTSAAVTCLNSLTTILQDLELKPYETGAQGFTAIDPTTPGTLTPVTLTALADDIFAIEAGATALATGQEIFIEYKFYPQSI